MAQNIIAILSDNIGITNFIIFPFVLCVAWYLKFGSETRETWLLAPKFLHKIKKVKFLF